MRITNSMMINNMIYYLQQNQAAMERLNMQYATNKKIRLPSDDPVVAVRALKLRTDVAKIEQYIRNVEDAKAWIVTTDRALDTINAILQDVREMAVKACNDTNTPEDRQKMAQDIIRKLENLIGVANSTHGDRFIFSGFKTDQRLLNDDGTFNVTVSKEEKIFYEVGISDYVFVNTLGNLLFGVGDEISDIPRKSLMVQDFEDFIEALDVRASYMSGAAVPMDGCFPLDCSASPIAFDLTIKNNVDAMMDRAVSVSLTGTYADWRELLDDLNSAGNLGGDLTATMVNGRLMITTSYLNESVSLDLAAFPEADRLFGVNPYAAVGSSVHEGTLQGSKNFGVPTLDVTQWEAPTDPGRAASFLVRVGGKVREIRLWDGTSGNPDVNPREMTMGQIMQEINKDLDGIAICSVVDGRIKIISNTGNEDEIIEISSENQDMLDYLFGLSPVVNKGGDQATHGSFTGGVDLTGAAYGPAFWAGFAAGDTLRVTMPPATPGGAYAVHDIALDGLADADGLVDRINAALNGAGKAYLVDGRLRVESPTWGTGSTVEVWGYTGGVGNVGIMGGLFGWGTVTPPVKMPGTNSFEALIDRVIGMMDRHLANLAVLQADEGARYNRLEFTGFRLINDHENFLDLMNNNEGAHMEKVILDLKLQENVYLASLSAVARVIQPTLLEFLR
ncbi:MAG: flagellar hook-associated protein FlgL [Oscillospiraceae bacterium]|nr:flagellar hook-associated protein FlgL [Oscillospiraceae bacterium]